MARSTCRLAALLAVFAGLPAWGQAQDGPFQVEDIQLRGLQRVSAGTVFNLLPVRVGDQVSRAEVRDLLRALFKSGYFADITAARTGGTLIIDLVERPAIEKIELEGNKAIKTEMLMKSLGEAGLREGEIFQRATLERMGNELARAYLAQGRYDAVIEPQVTKLPRNRVDVKIDIDEGQSSGVRHINIVGATVFSQRELLAQLELQHPSWLSFIRNKDKYSREKLQGDLETLEAYYQDRGYVEFNNRAVLVSVTPDRRSVYITLNVEEGERYEVDEVKLIGDLSDVDPELVEALFLVRKGQVFSRALVTATEERINTAFGNAGYTFASASGVPEIKDDGLVDVKFVVEAGKRAYVRRITFTGNTLTQDQVLRREMRQMEGGWASTEQIDRSKVRLDQLGFFKPESVGVETPAVAGTDDQIDVEFTVEEQPTGAYTASLGHSRWAGLQLQVGVEQKNVAGTGNSMGLQLSWSDFQQAVSFNFFNPYYTPDGISRGFNVFARRTDYASLGVAYYATDAYGAGATFNFPMGESVRLQFGVTAEHTAINSGAVASQEIADFIARAGAEFLNVKVNSQWVKSTLNHGLFPTSGQRHVLTGTLAVPGSDLEFYRLSYTGDLYYQLPFARRFSAHLRTRIGYGGVYGDTATYPFYEHFYAGGQGSVRGFERSTLGPRVADRRYSRGRPFGGNLLAVGTAELIFPLPFLDASKGVRPVLFFDAGNVFSTDCPRNTLSCHDFDTDELRAAAGVSVSWFSRMGPMTFTLAHPLRDRPGDEVERFSFQLGSSF